jgi:hypothetical protein
MRPGCDNAIGQILVFTFIVVIGYWLWHPLGAAALLLAVGSLASILLRVGITAAPSTAASIRRPSLFLIAGIWGGLAALVTAGSIMYLHIPTWTAALLCIWGWMAAGYPGWAEIPGIARYLDSSAWEVKSVAADERSAALNSLLENLKFFRLMNF